MARRDNQQDLAQLPQSGETIEGRYRLEETFASGGMGVIMRAEQLRTGRDVAVKILHPHIAAKENFAARFKREVRVATLFNHPNIVRVYDVGETDEGLLYLVMELLDGRELKELIAEEAPLRAGRVLDIAMQFIDGLAEAHNQDVIHRDLKPANIFVGRDRRGNDSAKILDFGIAKLVNSQDTQLTKTGKITGTPAYIAPEVLVGEELANRKPIDVYASGLIILEMLTGVKVFEGGNPGQVLIKHLQKPVRIPDKIARAPIGEVVRRATAKHPDDRYEDADQVLEALVAAREGTPDDLCLRPSDAPGFIPDTSPSLLDQVQEQGTDTNLEMLRDAPQHDEVPVDEDLHRKETVREQEAITAPGLDSPGPSEETNDFETTEPITDNGPTAKDRAPQPASDETDDDKSSRAAEDESSADERASSTSSKASDQIDSPRSNEDLPSATVVVDGKTWWRSTWAIVGGIGLVVVLGGGAFLVVSGEFQRRGGEPGGASDSSSEEPPRAATSSAVAQPDSGPERLEVQVASRPSGALVWEGNRVVGETDVTLEFAPGELPKEVRLEKSGYREKSFEIAATEDVDLSFDLEPEDRETDAATSQAQASKQTENDDEPERSRGASQGERAPDRQEETDPSGGSIGRTGASERRDRSAPPDESNGKTGTSRSEIAEVQKARESQEREEAPETVESKGSGPRATSDESEDSAPEGRPEEADGTESESTSGIETDSAVDKYLGEGGSDTDQSDEETKEEANEGGEDSSEESVDRVIDEHL